MNAPPNEGFLRRWARLKAHPEPAPAEAPRPVTVPAPPAMPPVPAQEQAALTLEDVARLTPQSDFSAFVAGGVDPAVRRLALKKLFADPNFAVMDGLDIYIDDYTKPSPLTGAMLATLRHAPGVLARLLGDSAAPGDVPAAEPAAPDPSPEGNA
jgi:hypothetical protein